MKKIIGLLLACFLAVPTVSFAHTHVQTTVPENGATVTAPLKEIKLTFETHIEKISTITVTKDGQKISLASQKVEGHDLIASLDQPLENGSYTVNWEIVGEDGHVMKDSIAFKVDVKDEAKEENTQAAGKDSEKKQDATQSEQHQKSAVANDEKTENNDSSSFFVITIIAIVVVVGALLLIFRKKKA
ncbi:copper resistance protein CopC [Priestia megaterium]|uniref:Copper resistance protein CopC n=1 Tax=Priestia megaterium TaxID=1404 RepID=A0ABD4WZU3_PRIMG|nr:copper resistance protein CopC [Priestia megaterium]MDD9785755.1 copper resistance protein CopC [Priestia megaterium]MED3853709.1 copper resistance protein CopC [Priestia megaterium]MED3972383.1 copper resistance protein CopC [Priestia megaterium]MED4795372.1 copper resistance protein CopC [Priestia megaterium]PEB63192.1 copper resistance protein [Priestia megaterium]